MFLSATNAFLISLPSKVFIGIFCKLGSLDASLPVVVAASKKEVWTLFVLGLMCSGRESEYVFFSFDDGMLVPHV